MLVESAGIFAPLYAPNRYKGAFGGRGGGKSRFFAQMMIMNARKNPGTRAVCVREVQKSLRDSSHRLLADEIIRMQAPGFSVRRDRIQTPGGGEILFQGLQEHTADSIKSLEGMNIAWIEEAHTLSAYSLELLKPTIRAPGSEIWAGWNPRNALDPIDAFLRGTNPPARLSLVEANYDANPWFPPELEEERIHALEADPHRYAHIWEGAYEPAVVGALWNIPLLHRNRARGIPDNLTRICIAIDVATTTEKTNKAGKPDETGLVAVGVDAEGIGYLLEDASGIYAPDVWARLAVALYDKYDADSIAVETNQGGDMIGHTLRTIRTALPIIGLPATRSKSQRAAPIAALYVQDRIRHAGTFTRLEAEMCATTAIKYEGPGSPNRLDALVWGFSHLFEKMIRPRRETKAPEANRPPPHWAG